MVKEQARASRRSLSNSQRSFVTELSDVFAQFIAWHFDALSTVDLFETEGNVFSECGDPVRFVGADRAEQPISEVQALFRTERHRRLQHFGNDRSHRLECTP